MRLKHEHRGARDQVVFDTLVEFSGFLSDKVDEGLKSAPKEKGDFVIVRKRIAVMVLPMKKTVPECHHRPPASGFDQTVIHPCPHSPKIDHGPESEIRSESRTDILIIGKDVQVSGLISVIQGEGPVFEVIQWLFEILGHFIGVIRAGAQELKFQPVPVGESGFSIHSVDPVEIIFAAAGRYKSSQRVFIPEVSFITEHSGGRW